MAKRIRRLQLIRMSAGMTQAQLASAVNVGQPKISQLENGIVRVSFATLQKIAAILKFPDDPNQLIEEVSF